MLGDEGACSPHAHWPDTCTQPPDILPLPPPQASRLTNERDELREHVAAEERKTQDQVKAAEDNEDKVAQLSARRDELARKIRELGTLPADAFDKYRSKGLKELIKQLPKVGGGGHGAVVLGLGLGLWCGSPKLAAGARDVQRRCRAWQQAAFTLDVISSSQVTCALPPSTISDPLPAPPPPPCRSSRSWRSTGT